MRTLIGLVLGIVLFIFGIPVLQGAVRSLGYMESFSYEQAVLALLLVLACVIAAQLTALRPRRDDPRDKE